MLNFILCFVLFLVGLYGVITRKILLRLLWAL